MNNLLIGSSWYSDGHQGNFNRTKKYVEPNWIIDYWLPYIRRYIEEPYIYIYISNCIVLPSLPNDIDYNMHLDDSMKLDHRNNYHAALMMSSQFALCNSRNLLWIEGDCLVKGLDKVLEWCEDKAFSYGCSKKCSYRKGWAAQSLIWVRNDYLPEFVCRLNKSRIHESTGFPLPEAVFHQLFKDDVILFPPEWGYDRNKKINWDDDVLFIQQMNDRRLNRMLQQI